MIIGSLVYLNTNIIKNYNSNKQKISSIYRLEKEKRIDEVYSQKDINELIEKYENAMVDAINNNDFSILEPYLIPNSNLYNMQKKLVERLSKRSIKEKLINVQVEDTKIVGNNYNVYVYEKFNIDYAGKVSKVKEFYYIYEVKNNNGRLGLSDIFTNEGKSNINNEYDTNINDENKKEYSNESNYESTGNWDYYPTEIDEVCSSPLEYTGKKIELSGTVVYVKEYFSSEDILISNGENYIHIYSYKKIKHYKGDTVTIYGKVIGETSEYRLENNLKKIPSINADYIYVYSH